MAMTTTNYGLTKPETTDNYDIEIQNGNMDKIDTELKKAENHRNNTAAHVTQAEHDSIASAVQGATFGGEAVPKNNGMLDFPMPTAAQIGVSNKNLLHNWDFRNPVNQRSITTHTPSTSQSYFFDRWYSARTNMEVTTEGLSLAWDGINEQDGWIQQKIEGSKSLFGKVVTFSIEVDGEILSTTLTVPTLANAVAYNDVSNEFRLQVTNYGDNYVSAVIIARTTTAKVITKCKLENGPVSTLANDPPADFGEQLSLCKRYYRLWTTEEARATALKEVGLMRIANPTLGTIVINGTTYYYADANL